MIGLSGVTTVALGAFLVVAPSAGADSGSGGGGDTQRIRMEDDCEPVSFNRAIGPGTCVGDGDTTFEDFVAQLGENGFEANESADDWEFKPGDVHIDDGDRLRVVNRGGEFHSFSEVPEFGAGCVPGVNELVGLGFDAEPVVNCEDPRFGPTFVEPGGTLVVPRRQLSRGTHLFECLIHPWMQTTVEVRPDDDHSGHG
jgi:hypothetical protein